MSLSSDGNTWERYKENNSTDRIFYGNYDRSTVIKQVLYESTSTRYMRVEPKTNHGAPCLRIEIYGHQLQSTCTQYSVGVPSPFIVPDHRFTASSSYNDNYRPSLARLDESGSWLAFTNTNAFLQIDLNQIFRICSVLTQGHSSRSYWVTRYKIKFSRDNSQWNMYREQNGVDKEFQGNTDKSSIVANPFDYPFKAKFVRVMPTKYFEYISLRVDFKGTAEACTFPLGLENKEISDSQITSSSSWDSSHGAARARLYGSSSWCSLSTSNTEYIQVDLGQVKTVTGVALQGDPWRNKWVTKFILSYGFSSGAWYYYTEGQVTKLFTGNSNRYDVIVKWLRRPIAARYVRILPRSESSGGRCLRFDLYGCDYVVTPIVAINTKQITVPSTKGSSQTLTCLLTGTPTPEVQWFHKGTKIAGESLPSYTVKFISAEYVVKYYSCTKPNLNRRAVICKTNITCRAIFPAQVPSAQPAEKSAEATVYLNVPKSPVVSLSPQKRSLRVDWSSVVSDDEGSIKLYVIEFRSSTIDVQPSKRWWVFSNLKPYTDYTIRMRATSAVGKGMWSSTKTVQTLIAEPEGRPVLYATAESSTSIKITWTFADDGKLNGPFDKFRITYTDKVGTKLTKNVGNVQTAVLTGLKKYTRYAITISVKNTMYYGPESDIVNQMTHEDAPSIAPRNIRVSKINETRFTVFWQPLTRKEANGIVTKYKISWTLKHIGRTKRMTSVGETFSKTTQGTQFVLSNLRLCAEYDVRVAGLTSVGAGPNATYTIITSKPGEPINLRSVEEGQTFINLQWEKPRGIKADVKSYQIYLEGSKPTYWTSYNDSKKESRDGSKTTLKIDNLQPGTRYDIWVIASTVCGESNKSSLATASTNIAKPKTPQGTVVTLKDSLNVTLWEVKPYNGPLSSYQVIVITNENQILKELPETLNNYENSKKKDQKFYITAEIAPDQLKDSKVFIIGDDKMYGIYKNVPLQKGGTYTIAERVITSHGEKRYSSDIVHVATIRLSPEPTKNAKSTSSSNVGATVGIVVALLVVIIVLALVGFKYKRNRDRKNEESSPMPLNDITSEPDGGNECESYLMTDDNDIPTRAQLSNEDRPQYVNVGLSANAAINNDGIYENPKDSTSTALTKRQFLELVKSCRATDYAQLKDEFKGLLNTHVYPVEIAKRPINKKKNRYANIVTYDHSRVLISPQPGDKNSDYVNASYIKGYDGSPKTYIATQGPNPVTVPDFWQMVWEQNTCTIVMLTNLKEGSKAKCHQYWPDSSETHRDFTVKAHKTEVFPDYIVRTFLLSKTNTNESRQINHFQFIVWPDKGVPQYSTAVLGLRRHVRKSNPDHAGPIVVHCSAGVGRTGAYIVIDAMLDRAKNLKNVDISNYVTCIRTDRPYMVQTDEQYVFIHLALYETFTCGNTEIQVHNLQITMNKLSSMNEQKNSTGYALEFERLKRVTEEYSQEKCDVGKLPVNIDKNRYKDKIALNRSRVLLSKPGETVSSNYINASHVDAYTQRNAFLVTQAPFEKTVEDFWIMIANYEVKTIVMLNALQEENEQFTQYWPESGTTVYGHVSVELKDTRSVGILTCRRLEVTYDTTAVQVQHIQMPNWVDKCCPENEQIVLDLLNEVEQSQRQTTSSPVVVHCSDGIGRSGTFCAAYSIIERAKQEQTIDIFQSVKQIRVNRPGAVETLTQYVFCYQIIQRYIDSFSDYANFEN